MKASRLAGDTGKEVAEAFGNGKEREGSNGQSAFPRSLLHVHPAPHASPVLVCGAADLLVRSAAVWATTFPASMTKRQMAELWKILMSWKAPTRRSISPCTWQGKTQSGKTER